MGIGKTGQVEKTAQQQANLEIANQQINDWRTRWMPQLKNFSANLDRMYAPDSRERRHAESLAGTDVSARFAQAGDKLNLAAANTGSTGSARQKLGIVGMGDNEATSAGFAKTQANQAVDDAYTQGEKAISSLARGEKANTLNALGQSADISARQAQYDADASLNEQAGYAGLASKIVGTGAGLWMGRKPTPSGVNANTPMDYSSGLFGTPQAGV